MYCIIHEVLHLWGAMLHHQYPKCHRFSESTNLDQALRFWARLVTCSIVMLSQPWRREPSGRVFELFIYDRKVRRSKRSGFILKMWPAKRSLRLTTAATRSNSGSDAVSRRSFPVMRDRQRLLNPLIIFLTLSVLFHASHAWVKAYSHCVKIWQHFFSLSLYLASTLGDVIYEVTLTLLSSNWSNCRH